MGKCNVKMEELLRAPLKRIPGSVVRIHDVYNPIKNIKNILIAEIKTVIYLEDLGIVESSNIDQMNINNENKINLDTN